jgi:hypothetical protein
MAEPLTPDAYYLPGDVAALLRVSLATLEYWRRVGGGPPFLRLPNRKIRYLGSDVLAWLAQHRQRTTSDLPRRRVVGKELGHG